MDEKAHSLRNEKLKANRASETEEQKKERPRIRREKYREGEPKNYNIYIYAKSRLNSRMWGSLRLPN